MTVEIISETTHPQGTLYRVRIKEHTTSILFLFHGLERMKKWGISDKMVLEALLLPEEVMIGHRGRYIAHRRYGEHVVRAVYEYQEDFPVLVTVYFPYADRYFEGGGIYEDQIFKGSRYPSD